MGQVLHGCATTTQGGTSMILPAPRQRVITVARPQRAIVDQRDQSGVQPAIEPRPGAALSSPACSPA